MEYHSSRYSGSSTTARNAAVNTTLGFEKILVLSRRTSWRTEGIKAAMTLTNLDIEIPPQPYISPAVVSAFVNFTSDHGAIPANYGSAQAWLAHLDLLKDAHISRFSTTLIMEDDVDWDIRIKSQIKLLSDNIRKFLKIPDSDETPYGFDWDVLWVGHCGDVAHKEDAHLQCQDDTQISTEGYNGWSKGRWIETIPEGHRQIQFSSFPLCSWAYAVTSHDITKILDKIGSGGDVAFDMAMRYYCTHGFLRCITVFPEIMSQHDPDVLGYVASEISQVNGERGAGDEVLEGKMGTTKKVVESARCKAVFGKTCLAPGAIAWAYVVGTGKGKNSHGFF